MGLGYMVIRTKFFTFTVLIIALCAWQLGCVPSAGTNSARKNKNTSLSTGSGTAKGSNTNPTFVDSLNFFQNGQTVSSASFTLDITFTDSFYLRGAQVNQYLAAGNLEVACLVFNFSNIDGSSKTLVLAGNPRSFNNFSTNVKENYYLIEPANKSLNATFCQTPGPLNYVGLNFPTSSLVYSLGDVCINCASFLLDSSPLEIVSQGGQLVQNIKTAYLDLRIKTQGTQTSDTSGLGCISSSECVTQGFDCCSSGQCVKDLTLKSGVDINSSDYLQALNEISLSPSNIYNYPNFYHICAKTVVPTPTPVVTQNPDDAATARLTMLRELYECSTVVEGEMSVCTITYKEANKSLALSSFTGFLTGADDRSFATTSPGLLQRHSIYEIIHAGTSIFKNGSGLAGAYEIPEFHGTGSSEQGGWNDDLDSKARVVLHRAKPLSAANDDLKIKYKIDGSCSYINSSLAKCQKLYVQGQPYGNPAVPQVTDHYPASNRFLLPLYADVSRTIKVEVDGTNKTASVDWNVVEGSPSYIQFVGTSLQVFDTQKVTIDFFVNLASNNVMQSKLAALNTIDQLCNCGGPNCTLKPVIITANGVNKVTDYTCVYPQPSDAEPPMQQTIYMSAKTVPYRYYDKTGVHHTTVSFDTPEQENSSQGSAFEYIGGNALRPNNVPSGSGSGYVGFNEIYGSFKATSDSPKPAKEVIIKNGKTYDIFVDFGTFSTCSLCGNDYYSTLAKIFPTNFVQKGGGYRPEVNKTDRFKVSTFRVDDLLFGRACFVPATMIPWTHAKNADLLTQRRNRLATQHFLFANGYQRDWYGFDYGAVIGSFDGVNWFAVGNQRRIKAAGNRLYLAVNAYYGDQTIDSTFTITISEANLTLGSGSQITADDSSDGAECRKYHICETDSDCAAQLGWEYTCETVGIIKTIWPKFDSNGMEMPNDEQSVSITSLLQGDVSGKRCVYRGRGAACHPNYYPNILGISTYNQVENTPTAGNSGLLACAPNFYCQNFLAGSDQALFNNRISRFAKSPTAQNLSSDVPEHDMNTFGLAARFIGRPYDYNGKEIIYSSGTRSNMSHNNIVALCIPGKNPNTAGDTFVANNSRKPVSSGAEKFNGDQVLNIGMTRSELSAASKDYLSSCGIFNTDKNYIYKANPDWRMDGATGSGTGVPYLAASQVTSTNLLSVFNNNTFNNAELTKVFSASLIESFYYQPNRCLRMPGSVCFTDQDCAANRDIANQLAEADPEQIIFNGSTNLNSYELRFWQNELICGQGVAKTNATYDLKKNHCCRDLGKDFKIAHGMLGPSVTYSAQSPHVNTSSSSMTPITTSVSSSNQRNSQMSTYMYEMVTYGTDPALGSGEPELNFPVADACGATASTSCVKGSDTGKSLYGQFRTIQTLGNKMCCSGHWVRNFHEENGGGHKWTPTKFQNIPADTLRCLNWSQGTGTGSGADMGTDGVTIGFTCNHVTDPSDPKCLIQSISEAESQRVFDLLGRFELLGIPQVPIISRNSGIAARDGGSNFWGCRVDPDNQGNAGTGAADGGQDDLVLPKLLHGSQFESPQREIQLVAGAESGTGLTDAPGQYYSAGDMTNFDTEDGLRAIFSSDTLSCCKPAGTIMDVGEDSANCCTGFVNQSRRCVLPQYTDITLYTNKYVSSAIKDLDMESQLTPEEGQIYKETGYILETGAIINAACTLRLCDGDTLALGIGWGPYNVPGIGSCDGKECKVNRFIQSDSEDSGMSDFWKAGVRWNKHVYCIPPGVDNKVGEAGMIVHRCFQ